MLEEKSLVAFYAYLDNEIRYRAERGDDGAEFKENAFVQIVTEHLAELGLFDEPTVCFYQGKWAGGAVRLNGYAVSDEGERLDLFVALYEDSGQAVRVPHENVSRVAGYAARTVAAAKHRIHERMEKASDAYAMMSHISELLASGLREVRVSVLTNAITTIRRIKPLVVEGIAVGFEAFDLRRLNRTMTPGEGRDVIEIDLAEMGLEPIPCVAMPRNGVDDYEAYLAVFSGQSLFQMYETFGPRLLEYNVRAFLQVTNKVNRGIRDTLKGQPEHFMAYNNGISITVDEVRTERAPEGGLQITHMKGLQIVNGGQTTASVHRARKRDRVDISKVNVAAKVTRLPAGRAGEMVPLISRYANTQNVIQEADFSSNEPFHIALERLSERVWTPNGTSLWFYERARGQYQTALNKQGTTPARLRAFRERTPPSQKFSKTDLAKFLNSWACLPNLVSGGAQKNFVAFMKSLREVRGDSWEPDETFFRESVAKGILFNAAVRMVRKEGFPAYRANITCYLVAYLSHRTGGWIDFEILWRRQAISPGLESLLRAWSHSISGAIQDSARGRNVTEWCKKEECWSIIKSLNLALPVQVPPELSDLS